MKRSGLSDVVEDRRLNAVLGWILVVLLLVGAVTDVTQGDLLWAGFTLVVTGLVVIPAVAYRSAQAMLPWEVVLLASVPILSRAFVAGVTVGGVTLTGRISTYLAVAAVALVVAVELDVFTPVRMNYSFAVFFVVVATTAAAGLWAVAQWLSDIFLGTAFLLDERPAHVVETALMWDFVAATLAGVLAGIVFEYYFRRRARTAKRLPEAVDAAFGPDEGGNRT